MTLDEAIKHAEEVAEEQEELYRICPASESEIFHCDGTKDCKTLKYGKNKGCQKCAEEHRQLAEWLKELKEYREQEPCNDVISRQWLMECVNEGWIKFDTEKDKNIFIHLVRDIAPPVTPVRPQAQTGQWLYKEITDDYRVKGQCSECKKRKIIDNFCPNCGAKMVEPQESEVQE